MQIYCKQKLIWGKRGHNLFRRKGETEPICGETGKHNLSGGKGETENILRKEGNGKYLEESGKQNVFVGNGKTQSIWRKRCAIHFTYSLLSF